MLKFVKLQTLWFFIHTDATSYTITFHCTYD